MLIPKQVDMRIMPEPASTPPRLLVIGDLHANAFKLVYHLQREGLIEGLTEECYKQLLDAYDDIYFRYDDIERNKAATKCFYEGAKQLKFKPANCKVVLLGDDMGDRGARDDLVAALYESMAEAGLDFEIMHSNHMRETVRMTEVLQDPTRGNADTTGYHNLPSPIEIKDQINSVRALGRDIQAGIVNQAAFISIFNTVVKPRMKALSYFYDKHDNTATLFSHAPMGLDTLRNMRTTIGQHDTRMFTIEQLMACIDRINAHFAIHAKNNTLSELYRKASAPFYFSIYNRTVEPQRPGRFNGVKLKFVHGHTSGKALKRQPHCVSLNNLLGMNTEANPGGYTGTCKVISYTPERLPETNVEEEKDTKRRKMGM